MAVGKIIKRDGRVVDFDISRIANAIFKAARAVGGEDYELACRLAQQVVSILETQLQPGEIPTVEQVQDIVEKVLVENGHYKTAKAYILYRRQHAEIRKVRELFSNVELIDNYIDRADWRVRENSNMTYSLQGLNFHVSSVIASQYWLEKIYPPEIREAHLSGDLHIHDLGILGPYCVGWDLRDLLFSGFKGVRGKISSSPPRHFRSALGQLVNFLYTLQGEAAGAQAVSNLDTLLAPFIRADKLDYKAVKQALQEFIFNLNVPTRVGFQTPFSNCTLDLKIPDFMSEEPVVVGGEVLDATYGEFQEEADTFNEAFAEVMLEGDADGRAFTFPIPTYNITSDFDWEDHRYEKIWRMTAKYGIPYFSNFIGSDMNPEDVRSMCCRLRIDNSELRRRGGGLFGANPLTGSIGVVTINMPRLGYLSRNEEEFFRRLDQLMYLAKESLEIKREVLENFTDRGLYPYSKFYLRRIKSAFGEYWKNHFSTIGLVGMNECCLNLFGRDIGTEVGRKFAIKVLDHIREKLSQFQMETGNIYNLEATPAEGTSYRLARIDKKRFPGIIVANEEMVSKGAEPYYTNSSQLPVEYTDDLFEALRLQEPLQTRYTGGTVFHIFIGEKLPPPESIGRLVRKICENFSIPYFTITPTFSVCPLHGYIFGEQQLCPKCLEEGRETECEVYSRIVGYLRPIDQWNDGKQAEFRMRRYFKVR